MVKGSCSLILMQVHHTSPSDLKTALSFRPSSPSWICPRVGFRSIPRRCPTSSGKNVGTSAVASSQLLNPNIPRLDLHSIRRLVELHADQPAHLAAGLVVIDQHGHHMAVNQLDDGIAAGDDMNFV